MVMSHVTILSEREPIHVGALPWAMVLGYQRFGTCISNRNAHIGGHANVSIPVADTCTKTLVSQNHCRPNADLCKPSQTQWNLKASH